ncbi:hypothetical protein POPTR_018G000700v4 [Populus trichocarpa]|uniref:Myb-like domain-containing protein n=1 Tax=Populus trichocarpa TaxID=3694 RepID=B9IN96_POPTR|nr:uncharacterized protein LOC7490512 isoform X1 [Populus trichocarpa]PNS91884.1 hypothetical protein POPTR_018G000700v4 [Populus trichocarpa]|eukprot:XP_024445791.1 uncharacterized protein LOC7490512 [Populus trichocarpa]
MPIHTRNSKNLAEKIHNDFLSPQKQNPAEKRSLVCGISHSGSGSRSAKFPVFRNNVVGVREVSTPRRSLLQDPNTNQLFNNKTSNCKSDDEGVSSSNKVKGEVETSNRRGVIIGLEASKARVSAVGICETKKLEIATADNNHRKRERAEGANKRAVEGWTKDQEMALQRAFFTAKPTPNFWKKVSKLVPGKSAQDCFDKVNSDHMTLPQTFPRSRAKRINSSPLECFSISVSKLLNPSGPKNKRLSCKQKSHLAHKNVRELLQKQNQVNRDYEADLFSILEPNQNSSMQDSKLAVEISTPEHSQEKLGFLHKLHESSSDHKRPLLRLSSCGIDIVSPPVLKQVKNKALHEKYIDQLHCREAKRKAAHARAGKSVVGKENRGEINVQKIDVVRAAKNALVSDVRDAIYQLQDVQTNASSSSDFHDDGVGSDDDGGESVL